MKTLPSNGPLVFNTVKCLTRGTQSGHHTFAATDTDLQRYIVKFVVDVRGLTEASPWPTIGVLAILLFCELHHVRRIPAKLCYSNTSSSAEQAGLSNRNTGA